jgi:hypothetical protein
MKKMLSVRLDENSKKILVEIAKQNKRSITRQIEYWIATEKPFIIYGSIKHN